MKGAGRTAGLPALFALTLFVSAGLLFSVQPMVARMVLPRLGGSPAVWTTCVLFFQAMLLAGYAYVHATSSWLGVRAQALLHLPVLLASFLLLPFAPPADAAVAGLGLGIGPGREPTWELLGWLGRSVGLPFFALAATAPLLQRWFAATAHRSARDPYFLYAASNAGSLAALIGYPLWLERRLSLGAQSRAWTIAFAFLPGLVALCATASALRRPVPGDGRPVDRRPGVPAVDWLAWVALAWVPSSLMLGLTTYLTTDLASVPLLWVAPLALYLVSFILVFSRPAGGSVRAAERVLPWLVMVQAPVMGAGLVQPFWIPLHVMTFFAAAVVCHGELARRRPPADRLTAFYLAAATGGALGGVFNALVAPFVFDRVAEYPAALVAACLVLGLRNEARARGEWSGGRVFALPAAIGLTAAALCADVGGLAERGVGVVATMAVSGLTLLVASNHRRRPLRFALTVGALLAASGLSSGVSGRVIYRERSFFGVSKVTEVAEPRARRLFHGSTLHGQQSLDPARRREPSTYFDRSGPIGQVFAAFLARPGRAEARVAVTGLGAGSLAAYALPGQRWTFYEIDPSVVRIARDPRFFTYLDDCRAASLDVVLGDARLSTARAPDGGFDLIVLDAFSSDAIPVHLLSREALALDRRKLARGGLIVVNITNRYLDLAPVVALLARDAGLVCRVRADLTSDRTTGKQGSVWAVMAGGEAELGELSTSPQWFTPAPAAGDAVWTDDFSDLLDHLRFGPVGGRKGGP